jgi:predicted DNA binding CopG/RHH family protein
MRTGYMMKKKIPKFVNEDQERDFWSSQDSVEYIEWKQAQCTSFPKLKPSTKTISIRLPESNARRSQNTGKQEGHPQSLLKAFLAERIKEEFRSKRS